MTFNNSILAGTTLVRDAIKSENYVAAVSGWQIERDGDAEFNDVIVRGEFQSVGVTNSVSIQNGNITAFTNSVPDLASTQVTPNNIILTDSSGVASQVRQQTVRRFALLSSNETIISDSVLGDTGLVVPVDGISTYAFHCYLIYSSATAADVKFTFTGPAGSVAQFSGYGIPTTVDGAFGDMDVGVLGLGSDFQLGGGGVGVKRACRPCGTLDVDTTAGNLTLQWAQRVSTSSNTVLYAGSWIELQWVGVGL